MGWRQARSIATLRAELDERFPSRLRPDWTIGDAAHRNRASDHNPNAVGVVCAVDVRSVTVARWLWDFLLSSRDPRIKYVIHDGRIFSSYSTPQRLPWTPGPYSGSNPHRDHLHLSVGVGPSGRSTRPDLYDDPRPWGIVAADRPLPPTPPPDTEDTMTDEEREALAFWTEVLAEARRDDPDVRPTTFGRHVPRTVRHLIATPRPGDGAPKQ